MNRKPALSFWRIWNTCFGFLGTQFGFALQNANVSRIFQAFGASATDIPALWVATPLTGLLVQPLKWRILYLAGTMMANRNGNDYQEKEWTLANQDPSLQPSRSLPHI